MVQNAFPNDFYSQENIFKPLGMTTASFYLTPELKAKAISLTFPVNGKFELFVDRTKVIEKEPSRGERLLIIPFDVTTLLLPFSK